MLAWAALWRGLPAHVAWLLAHWRPLLRHEMPPREPARAQRPMPQWRAQPTDLEEPGLTWSSLAPQVPLAQREARMLNQPAPSLQPNRGRKQKGEGRQRQRPMLLRASPL